MRITIQVTCDDAEDAQRVIKKLTMPDNTWVAQLEKEGHEVVKTKIMGSSVPKAAEQEGSNDGAISAPRPNNTPGEPIITKIGNSAKSEILAMLGKGEQPHSKYGEHCRLLWKRGEVKYDGKEFFL